MQIRAVRDLADRKKADVLIVPCWQGDHEATLATTVPQLKMVLEQPLRLGDFKGKEGEVGLLYLTDVPESRALLVGLGRPEMVQANALRLAYGGAAKRCRSLGLKTANLLLPTLDDEALLRGAWEGLFVANYAFDQLKESALKDEPTILLEKVSFIGPSEAAWQQIERARLIAKGVTLARDLVNSNADDLTPEALAARAHKVGKEFDKLSVTTFDQKRIEKEGMGLLLAVNRGSDLPPAFIIAEYKGDPRSKDHTILVGKGITYDTGGLNLKPTGSMETMKTDMGGAATCLGTIQAVAALGLKINVTAVIPSTENSVGSHAYKPGDVYRSYAGKTVEIGNTDAEGRLALADALAYAAEKLKPTRMIDLATLTGSIVIALGEEIAGLNATDDELADRLIAAGQTTGETIWRMPLPKSYRKQLKSELADLKNVGGRPGGSITAALFLKEFVGDVPWAHFDIAGTAYPDKPVGFNPVRATGFGVRLLVEFLEQLAES
jgi:leucyl aminopeptidase